MESVRRKGRVRVRTLVDRVVEASVIIVVDGLLIVDG